MVLGPDMPTVFGEDHLANGQSETSARAILRPAIRRVFFENCFQMFRCDTPARVADIDTVSALAIRFHPRGPAVSILIPIGAPHGFFRGIRTYLDLPSFRSEFARVLEQVHQYLFDL